MIFVIEIRHNLTDQWVALGGKFFPTEELGLLELSSYGESVRDMMRIGVYVRK